MSPGVDNHIADYVGHFRRQLQYIEEYRVGSRDGELHARILYTSIIDALSRCVFPRAANRDRVVRFVRGFCEWSDCDRVSLSHLHGLVVNKREPELARLRNLAIQRLSQWIRASKILLDRDPPIAEVEAFWPNEGGRPKRIDGVALNHLQHSQLLYMYRNSLIHEFRLPGRHVELWDDTEPYYAYLGDDVGDGSPQIRHSWELQYTAKFFRRLCETGISKLEASLVERALDPYESIDWGNYWIRELNL